jgi:CHASE3 domain sensor protein
MQSTGPAMQKLQLIRLSTATPEQIEKIKQQRHRIIQSMRAAQQPTIRDERAKQRRAK